MKIHNHGTSDAMPFLLCQKEYIHWRNEVNENGYCIKHVNILPPLLCVKLKL